VSTFNEYHENTHVEASSINGDRYIRMTREFAERIRSDETSENAANE
jgi:hypothetical protein